MLSAYDRLTHTPLSLSLSLSLFCLLSPLLTCHTFLSYPLMPPFHPSCWHALFHTIPVPILSSLPSFSFSNPFLFLCYSLSPFHLTCLLPSSPGKPPLTLSSPHPLLPSSSHFPLISHFSFSLTSLSFILPLLPFFVSPYPTTPLCFFFTLTHFSPHSPL